MLKKKAKAEDNGAPVTDASGESAKKQASGERATSFLYEVVSVFITAFLILAITFTFIMRFIGVMGQSMEDTLHSGDWVFKQKHECSFHNPSVLIRAKVRKNLLSPFIKVHYFEVFCLSRFKSQPNKYHENIIKRVIATEGQTIDIDFSTGKVYLDGAEIVEPYIKNDTTNYYDVKFPLTVPDGCCFVMGDNRQGSVDSRSSIIGVINNSYVLGKAGYALTDNGITDLDLYRRK